MKTVIVVNSAWAAYNFRLNLAFSLKNAGYQVVFLIPFDTKYSNKLQENFQCYDLYLNAKGLSPFQDIKTLISLIRFCKIIGPDIICLFSIKPNIYGSIAGKVLGIPSIANITGLGTAFIKKTLLTYIAKILYKFALSGSYFVFFQNSNDQLFFINNKLINKSKSKLLPGSGVDLKRFKPSSFNRINEKFIFLLVSRLLEDKGILEYIEAIRHIKKNFPELLIEFQILGEIDAENRTTIKKNQVDKWVNENIITYLGVSDEVQNVIAKCDCIVLPSYREGMPRSILEAFAMEKPAIVSNAPGCNDIVDDEINGFICKVRSSSDLADKMLNMYRLPNKTRKQMGINGRKKVEKFYNEKIVISEYIKSINCITRNEEDI